MFDVNHDTAVLHVVSDKFFCPLVVEVKQHWGIFAMPWVCYRVTILLDCVFTVRHYALHGLSYRNSVRPSVCHTRALCPHGSTYDHDFFTIW